VLDARTGMSGPRSYQSTFEPRYLARPAHNQLGNPALIHPFEPGSVNNIITRRPRWTSGLDHPMTASDLAGQHQRRRPDIHDAWTAPQQKFTLTDPGPLVQRLAPADDGLNRSARDRSDRC